jgi:hypothetical protein
VLQKLHSAMKKVPGFQRSERFVCKEHWDMKYFARFDSLKGLTDFMESPFAKGEVEQTVKTLEKLSKDGKIHIQNFVADDWN